jgi:hypothetical protein
MSYGKELIRATITVNKCLENSAPSAPRESKWLARGLRTSCDTIGDLLVDVEFAGFLRFARGQETLRTSSEMLKECQHNRERLERFLASERDLLTRAGLPTSVVDGLIEKCRTVMVELRYKDGPPEFGDALGELQRYVCDRARQAEAGRRRGILGGMGDLFGGLTVATLNGGLLAASLGLTGAASAASIAVGSFIAGDGYLSVMEYL